MRWRHSLTAAGSGCQGPPSTAGFRSGGRGVRGGLGMRLARTSAAAQRGKRGIASAPPRMSAQIARPVSSSSFGGSVAGRPIDSAADWRTARAGPDRPASNSQARERLTATRRRALPQRLCSSGRHHLRDVAIGVRPREACGPTSFSGGPRTESHQRPVHPQQQELIRGRSPPRLAAGSPRRCAPDMVIDAGPQPGPRRAPGRAPPWSAEGDRV